MVSGAPEQEVKVLRRFAVAEVEVLLDKFMGWKQTQRPDFYMDVFVSCSEAYLSTEVLAALLGQHKFPIDEALVSWLPLLLQLQGVGLVEPCVGAYGAQSAWSLTERGFAQIRTHVVLQNPYKVCQLRQDLPLQDRTSFELMQLLDQQGWEWQQLPRQVAQRRA